MNLLSRKDVSELIENLEARGVQDGRPDSALIRAASTTVETWKPRLGFSDVLLDRTATICRHLLDAPEGPWRQRTRGVLSLICQELGRADQSRPLKGQALAFVAGFVVHELRERDDADVHYRPFALSQADRQTAEDLLMALCEESAYSDAELLTLVEQFEAEHRRLDGSRFFGRLLLNLSTLRRVLQSGERDAESRSWARAGLAYLVEAEDAIDDRLGLLGLVDDAFVAALVASIIEPDSPPWTEILDRLYAEWPFLDEVVLLGEGVGRSLTEFTAINAALACRKIRRHPETPLTLLLPEPGPVPLLLATFAAVALLQECFENHASPPPLEIGQTVRLDNRATAHFLGCQEFQGEKRLALRFWNHRGLEETAHLPLDHRLRLTPTAHEVRPRGPIDQTRKFDIRLSALEYLFHTERPHALFDMSRKVLLVSPIGHTRALASEIQLCGIPLHRALPMGHQRNPGGYEPWAKKYATLSPVLEVVPSLAEALTTVREESDAITMIVVDLRGANAGRLAELDELCGLHIPLLLIVDEYEERALDFLEKRSVDHWIWTPDDLKSLVWPARPARSSSVGRYEERIRLGATGKVRVIDFEDARVERVFEHFYCLRREISRLGEDDDVSEDSFRVLDLAFSTTFPFLRIAPAPDARERAARALREMLDTADLTEDLIESARLLLDAVETASEPSSGLSRSAVLEQHMAEHPEARLVVRDEWERHAVLDAMALSAERVTSLETLPDISTDEHLVVSGWLGRKRMSRILSPPIAASTDLVANAIERDWYRRFCARRERLYSKFARPESRARVFSGAPWRQRLTIAEDRPSSSGQRVDRDELHEERRRRFFAEDRWSDDESNYCDAHLVLFAGHDIAFWTPQFRAPLLSLNRGRASIHDREVMLDELRRGDAVFLPTEAFERLVHKTATRNLPTETTQHARLWRVALDRYLEGRGEAALAGLQERLAAEGCKRHLATVRSWIRSDATVAPRNYQTDLPAIARVTGDRDLSESLDECVQAIQSVYSARKEADTNLRQQADDALRRALDEPGEAWRTFGFRDVFRVAWIDDIEPETRSVPRSVTNRLLLETRQ